MTDEIKNKIWAMLTQEEKEDFQGMYELKGSNFDKGYNAALDEIFGTHNLTAPAEEKSKEPMFKVGDKVINYQQYRLDLAKEIAVAMIRNTYVADEFVENIATAANLANEIVKRLKETDI